ncbi:Protein kinase domain protein [Cryptosporidium meleagridis]|uniref:Protein kinase domain protein n=1 Tax=Cryptosporidium meleagridis TaxID=93969 RepID=A0A2P4YXU8_9CRYT|nr:Protein kinase domain protein [Cryptosporidium meleagridis]
MDFFIGGGAFGTVKLLRDSESGKLIVNKIANSVEKNDDLKREEAFLRKLGGKHVVETYGSFMNESGLFTIILEYFPTDLRKIILQGEVSNFFMKKKILFGILKGIDYIHSLKIAHNDLKPENILVSKDCNIKICDFGMATETNNKTIECNKILTNLKYKSPERLLGTRNSNDLFASDIWSFGCIALELLTGKTLFSGRNEIDQLFGILRLVGNPSGTSLEYLKSLPSISESGLVLPVFKTNWDLLKLIKKEDEAFFELIRSSLNPSSIERITAKQALRLEIFLDFL